MDIDGSFTIDDGWHPYGVHKQVTFEGDQAITKLTYDAQPYIEDAQARRIASSGDRWGDGHHVGTIPMVEYNKIIQDHKTVEERKAAILQWLKARPALVSFDKFLK